MAIITLEDEVPELPNVRPVCLAQQGGSKLTDQTATVVGWGSLKENGPQPNILQEVTVRIWDNKVCKETYGPAAPGGIKDHMLCAGQKGKDSCSVSTHIHILNTTFVSFLLSSILRETLVARCRLGPVTLGPRLGWSAGESGAASPTTRVSTPGSPNSEPG